MLTNIQKRNNVVISGEGHQPMLFAHGFGCDQSMWRFVARPLKTITASSFSILSARENRTGRPTSAERYSTLDGYARDVLEICHELDLHDVIFVGHSVSSMVGILAANEEPDRFAKLILIGPSPRYINDGDYVGGFERADIEGLLDTMERNYLGWASFLTPIIMKNPGAAGAGEGTGGELLLHRSRDRAALCRGDVFSRIIGRTFRRWACLPWCCNAPKMRSRRARSANTRIAICAAAPFA